MKIETAKTWGPAWRCEFVTAYSYGVLTTLAEHQHTGTHLGGDWRTLILAELSDMGLADIPRGDLCVTEVRVVESKPSRLVVTIRERVKP